MGKTRNLRRSKKVVKTKRTRLRVSKKNGKKTHKKRYRSRKKRGGLHNLNSAEVYALLKKNKIFKEDDDDYNNRLLTEVSENKTVKNAKNPDVLHAAIIHAAKNITDENFANENASLHIKNFPNNPPETTINDASVLI